MVVFLAKNCFKVKSVLTMVLTLSSNQLNNDLLMQIFCESQVKSTEIIY